MIKSRARKMKNSLDLIFPILNLVVRNLTFINLKLIFIILFLRLIIPVFYFIIR